MSQSQKSVKLSEPIESTQSVIETSQSQRSVKLSEPFQATLSVIDESSLERAKSQVTLPVSENVPVRNFPVEAPRADHFSKLKSAAICSVIQESLSLFDILKYTVTGNREFRYEDKYATLDEKYTFFDDSKFIYRQELGLPPLVPTYADKILGDTNFVVDILKKTVEEIQKGGNFDFLISKVNKIVQIQQEEKRLEENYAMWLETFKDTKQLIETNKQTNAGQLKELRKETGIIKSKINAIGFENIAKIEYTKRWEANRLKHEQQLASQKEQKLQDKILELKKTIKNETLIFEQLKEYLTKYIADVETEIPKWTAKYNEDFEKLQLDIVYLQEDIDDQKAEILEMKTLWNERQQFIDQCARKRERIRLQEEHMQFLHKCATVIQTAWRGYMVRHLLGRYGRLWRQLHARKKKGKSKKGKKKKK